jgi:hypothetical protein
VSQEFQGKVRDVREGSPTPAQALQAISRLKAQEVKRKWDEFEGKNLEGVAGFQTKHGQARIGGIVHREDPDGLDSVEVWVGPQSGPPTYRLINPPTLVPDPSGDVILTERDPLRQKDLIRRYRFDPLQCIAEVVASRGSEG